MHELARSRVLVAIGRRPWQREHDETARDDAAPARSSPPASPALPPAASGPRSLDVTGSSAAPPHSSDVPGATWRSGRDPAEPPTRHCGNAPAHGRPWPCWHHTPQPPRRRAPSSISRANRQRASQECRIRRGALLSIIRASGESWTLQQAQDSREARTSTVSKARRSYTQPRRPGPGYARARRRRGSGPQTGLDCVQLAAVWWPPRPLTHRGRVPRCAAQTRMVTCGMRIEGPNLHDLTATQDRTVRVYGSATSAGEQEHSRRLPPRPGSAPPISEGLQRPVDLLLRGIARKPSRVAPPRPSSPRRSMMPSA